MLDKSLKEALFACNIIVSEKINELLASNGSQLLEAMRYSAVSDGKKIRPFVVIITAQMFGVGPLSSLNAAAALEFIHTYSLVHDDLPAMDDDDFRRGRPSCHRQFNEATAILAGDALLTYAFEILAKPETHKEPAVRCELIKTIATAAGFNGMIGGQMMDLESANSKLSKEQVAKLHRLKTGELFMAAAEVGAILGHASPAERAALRYYAHDIGLAFQIRDDILDHQGITNGKINIDDNQRPKENVSIVEIVGLEGAVRQLVLLKEQSVGHLKIFGEKAALLCELAEFIINRTQ